MQLAHVVVNRIGPFLTPCIVVLFTNVSSPIHHPLATLWPAQHSPLWHELPTKRLLTQRACVHHCRGPKRLDPGYPEGLLRRHEGNDQRGGGGTKNSGQPGEGTEEESC